MKSEELEAKIAEEEVADMLKSSDFEPSTKMLRMIELVLKWREEAPEDKVIIYSQCMLIHDYCSYSQLTALFTGTSMLDRASRRRPVCRSTKVYSQ